MKKVFLDTNVILEGLMRRDLAGDSEAVLKAIAEGKIAGFISAGSFYTITFYAEKRLKEIYIDKAQRQAHLRQVMSTLLSYVTVVPQDNHQLSLGVSDTAFGDMEDSYQMQACLASGCDCLVTINTKDFPTDSVAVIHLSDFVSNL